MQTDPRVDIASQPASVSHGSSRVRWLVRVLAGTGFSGVVLLLGFAWGARAYVREQLLPNIEAQMERSLGRDVELGTLRFVLPWQISVGRSQIEDLADIQAIHIGVDVGELWRSRELGVAVRLDRPDIQLTETREQGWMPLPLNLNDNQASPRLPTTTVAVTLRNGRVTARPLVGETRVFERARGTGRLIWGQTDRDRRADFDLQTVLDESPVELNGRVLVPERRVQLAIAGEALPANLLTSIVPNLPLAIAAGEADVELKLGWQPQQPLELDGTVRARQAAIALNDVPVELNNLESTIRLEDRVVHFTEATGTYRDIPFAATGTINWSGEAIVFESPTGETQTNEPIPAGFELQARVEREPVNTLLERLGVKAPLALASQAAANVSISGPLNRPQVSGNLRGLTPLAVDDVSTLNTYSGDFEIEGAQVAVRNIQGRLAAGNAGTVNGAGMIDLRAPTQTQFRLDLTGADANALAAAYGANLPKSGGTLSARATVDLDTNTPLVRSDWQLAGGDVTGQGQLAFRQGDITVSNVQLNLGGGVATGSFFSPAPTGGRDRQFSGNVRARQIDTGFFTAETSGPIDADLEFSGNATDFSLAALQAGGQVALPTGIANAPGPIAARVQWDGQAVSIIDGTALDGARISGRIPFDVERLAVGPLDIDVTISQLPLADVPQLPSNLPANGIISLTGRLSGPPDALQFDSQVDLQQFQAAGFAFAALQGPLRWQPGTDGVDIDLREPSGAADTGDRVALRLNSNFSPVSLTVRQGGIEAIGQRAEDNPDEFLVQLQNVPLALAGAIAPGEMAGTVDGNARINLATRAVQGQIQANELAWSGLELRRFQTGFAFADGSLSVEDGEIAFANSLYRFDGTATLPGDIPLTLDLRVRTENGSLQDLIQTLHLRQWSDLTSGQLSPPSTKAADLTVSPLTVLSRPLYERLEAYSSVLSAQRSRKNRKRRGQVPELENLQGNFEAELHVSGSPANLAAGFSLSGRDWSLNPYQLNTVSLRGSYRDGELTLASLDATQGDRSGSFVGTLGLQRQEGQLEIERFPVEIVSRFLPDLPDFSGDLDATATIGGNLQDPQARGQLQLVDAFLNGEPLEEVSSAFNYRQGRLEVDGMLLATGTEPLSLQGNIPYRLPFSTVTAPSDRLDLKVRVKNEGLKMLDIFTDVASWEAGAGLLDIAIGGTLQEPTVRGNLTVSDGVVTAKVLPQPIQQLNGNIAFDLNRLTIDTLSGRFSQGTLSATGQLPINSRGALTSDTPLTLSLADVELTLPNNLYSGGVNGRVIVTGTALQPELGGQIELSNGDIDVGTRNAANADSPDAPSDRSGWQLALNDLTLSLGKAIRVKQGLLFSFTAAGDLDIGGTPDDLQPEGTIRLERGRLNLGAASFRLDRSFDNTAVFSPDAGLDPLLNVRVFTQATEVSSAPNSPTVFDDNPSEFGGQQNIRIQATVSGRASELNNSTATSNIVELTSSPARTEEEIFALLGANALGNIGDATLTGFALAALQFSIQDSLGDFFGLDELRINSFANPDGSDFGLGLEAAKDLGRDLSVSLQRTFTDPDEDTRYNLRYRINDSLLLRSGTDFQGDSQGSIEYETRF